jgi:signal recognition particle receptor subunit beta
MKEKKILLFDENVERAREIESGFKAKDIQLSLINNESELENFVSNSKNNIILLTHQSLAKVSKSSIKFLFRQADSKKILVYAVPNDATKIIAFYKLGAYRVLDESFESAEIIEYVTNLYNQHNNNGKHEETRFSGSLSDFSLPDLINSFGRDKVSGILRVYTPYCSGKMIFNKGDIDDAVSGYHYGEEAVLFMLTWTDGFFAMRKCPIKSPKHKVQLSNIGLLLHGESERNTYKDIIRKIGHAGVSVKLVNRGDVMSQLKNNYYKVVAEKLANFTVLQEVLAYSQINFIKLADWLLQLKSKDNLEIRDDSGIDIDSLPELEIQSKSGLVEHLLGAKEVDYLREILHAEEFSMGKLLILATDVMDKTNFIHIFNQGDRTPVRTNKELDYTRIDLDDYFSLNVFGVSLDQKLKDSIEKVSQGLLGYIILINAQKPENFEYANYIIGFLNDTYTVPWTVAITNTTDDDELFSKIESKIKIPENRDLIPCDVTQKDDIKNVILSLI